VKKSMYSGNKEGERIYILFILEKKIAKENDI
jgi:hypothetical protein